MDEKYSFLVIKYPKVDTAKESLAALKQLSKEKVVKLKDAVAITKTAKGKIKLQQTKDDSAGKGFVKGGLIGILFAALFGPAGWVAAGALLGTAFATFDRGIKNKLLKELGEKMTQTESAVAILVERADWPKAVERMRAHNFEGVIVVSEIVEEDMAEVEKLLDDGKTVASVPEEMEVPAAMVLAAVEETASEPAMSDLPDEVKTMVAEAEAGSGGDEALAVRQAKKLEYIKGMTHEYYEKLFGAGILTVDDLLKIGSTPQGRNVIARETGISGALILQWVNMADLYRVKGIGREYAELLEAAGVDTVPELAQRVPANLLAKMGSANETKKMVRRMPVLNQVESWVDLAKTLPRVVIYK